MGSNYSLDNMGLFLMVLLHKRLEFGNNRSSNPSSGQNILTGEFDDGYFQQMCVTSIRNSRYKSWMLKTVQNPQEFSPSHFC